MMAMEITEVQHVLAVNDYFLESEPSAVAYEELNLVVLVSWGTNFQSYFTNEKIYIILL